MPRRKTEPLIGKAIITEIGQAIITSQSYRLPGLTEDQIIARRRGLGASDAERIMSGNWGELWKEKTGRSKGEDLSANLAVQMGNVTEAFNAYWYTLKTGVVVNRSPDIIDTTHIHSKFNWMLANIDGTVVIDARHRLFEAKHTNPFGSQAETPAKYYAQVQHALEVMDMEGCEMSVFFGNSGWQQFSIERDPDYAALMMEWETDFWQHVVDDKPPEDMTPAEGPKLELMHPVDMRTNNQWGHYEATWVAEREHRLRFDDAESKLKAMMPVDCDFAYGQQLVCLRDRAGKLSLRYPNNKDTIRKMEAIEAAEDRPEGLEI